MPTTRSMTAFGRPFSGALSQLSSNFVCSTVLSRILRGIGEIILAVAIIGSSAAMAQAVCQTFRGACQGPSLPPGAQCNCYGDPGRISYPAGGSVQQSPQFGNVSGLCRTNFGVCRILPIPIGTGCFCRGDPGMVIQ
jgi:hypothetical protein